MARTRHGPVSGNWLTLALASHAALPTPFERHSDGLGSKRTRTPLSDGTKGLMDVNVSSARKDVSSATYRDWKGTTCRSESYR